jgi:hypothetical protein
LHDLAGHFSPKNLILAAYVLAMEATFIGLEGFPDSRKALICTFISCCLATVILSHISFAMFPKSAIFCSHKEGIDTQALTDLRVPAWGVGVGHVR